MSDSELLSSLQLSEEGRKAIMDSAIHVADFMICRNRVRILSNTPVPIDCFSFRYGHFRQPERQDPADLLIYCNLDVNPKEQSVTLLAGDKAYRSREPEVIHLLLPALAYLVFMNIRTHYLLHAGCVSRNEKAIILSGASGMGKTTLIAHLISRGMGFLSDELAPVHRASVTVDPFPLRLGIRPGPALELVQDLPGTTVNFEEDRKKLVDSYHLGAPPLDKPVPLHAVIFLSQRISTQVSTPRKFQGTVRVDFMAMTDSFRRDLVERTRTKLIEETKSGARLVSITLDVDNPTDFLLILNEVTKRHGIPLAGIEYENLDPKDYSMEPQLVRLPAAAGVIELIKKMPSTQKAELIRREFDGKMPLLIKEVSVLADRVMFYKLKPGRLDKMIALIEGLA